MVSKQEIINIINFTIKNYDFKNHKDKFTPITYTTMSGKEVTIHVLELTSKKTFIKKITEAKNTNDPKDKWRVDIPSIEDLEGTKIYQTWNGCTFAIRPDGDIVNVCAKIGDNGFSADNMEAVMDYATEHCGGTKLDSFDGNYKFYRKCGFEPRTWISFDESFGDEIGWVKGRDLPEPVIFMEYTKNKQKLSPKEAIQEKQNFYKNTPETTMDDAKSGEEYTYDVAYRQRDEQMK